MVIKIDFFCGAFLSYLISNGITPALFEAGEKSKIVKFSTDAGDYKVYIKYSTSCKVSDRKNTRKWDVLFTKKEMEIIHSFPEPDRKLFFVLVCTDSDLKYNEIAVLDYKSGLLCLGEDSVNKERRISVIHRKNSPYMLCYGTAVSENHGVRIYKDFNRYFMQREKISI